MIVAGGIAALVLAGCSSSSSNPSSAVTMTASRYSSVSQVVAALQHGHLPCTGGDDDSPVVQGASSETLCNFSADETGLIDVFPGNVSTATVLQNSVSTGDQQIFSVVGPNWWVQASNAYAGRVRAILGGRIIAGPWHPSSAAAVPAEPSASAVASAPPTPFQSRTLVSVSGSGEYTTEKFTVGGAGDYDIDWTYSEGSFGQSVNFNFYADGYDDSNVIGPNQLGTGGDGVTHVYGDPGTHYLQIASEGDWTVKVVTKP
jgi:hypothetical protein